MAKQMRLFEAADKGPEIAARAEAKAKAKGRKADDEFYRFEDAVGHAGPFRFIGVIEFPSKGLAEANPDAYQNALREIGQQQRGLGVSGGACDVCGHPLMVNFVLQAADGFNFVVGCDCIHRSGEMTSEIKEAKKRSDRARAAALEGIRQQKARKAFLAKIGADGFVTVEKVEASAWELHKRIRTEAWKLMKKRAADRNAWLIEVLSGGLRTRWGDFCYEMARELGRRYLDLDNFSSRQIVVMADIYAKQTSGGKRRNSKAYAAQVAEFSEKSGLAIETDNNYPCFA